jgi:hypothetical protein
MEMDVMESICNVGEKFFNRIPMMVNRKKVEIVKHLVFFPWMR